MSDMMVTRLDAADRLMQIVFADDNTPRAVISLLQTAIWDAEEASICNDVFIPQDTTHGRLLRRQAEKHNVYHIIVD